MNLKSFVLAARGELGLGISRGSIHMAKIKEEMKRVVGISG
jgi:hypothetical protein